MSMGKLADHNISGHYARCGHTVILSLGFAIPLTFMTIIVPYLSGWPHLVAILVWKHHCPVL